MEPQATDTPQLEGQTNQRRTEEEATLSDVAPPAGTLSALIAAVRQYGERLLSLVILEGKQAGLSLALMLGMAVAAGVLVITGWLAIIACIVVALVANDVIGWTWALVIAALLSFAGAAGLIVLLMQRSDDLLFTATRRQFRPRGTGESAT